MKWNLPFKMTLALVHYEKKEFKLVLKKLKPFEVHKPKDIHIMVRQMLLRLISMYELNAEFDEQIRLNFNFEKYLQRNSSFRMTTKKEVILFLHFLRKLLMQKKKKETIIQEVSAAKAFYYKAWLLEKLEDYQTI